VEVSRILIDTSAYAAHLTNHPEIKEELQRASEVFVSVVVLSELRAGFLKGSKRARNETILREFLSSPRVRILDMDEGTSEWYAAIHDHLRREGPPIPANDVWIAASAAQNGLKLLTTDDQFKKVPHVLLAYFEPPAP
jgi:tRNA(fMet)-specific endonuclease VapC